MSDFTPVTDACFLTGPTAAGKTDVGVELALRIGAEIVSMDSMAVYRGMDVGTAKPSPAEQQRVTHHVIDVIQPNVEFSISQYLRLAHEAADDIRRRGRRVLFVGGTPLYLKALLHGLETGPQADDAVRDRLLAEAAELGSEILHNRLSELDPKTAEKTHPRDTRRIVRALEVYEKTGQPISDLQYHFEPQSVAKENSVFVLDWPRAKLHERINARVERMFAAGLPEEARQLADRYGRLSRTASQAAGYREMLEHFLDKCSLEEAVERTKARTRQLARRQLIWFRAMPECTWISMTEPVEANRVADKIVERLAET